MLDSGTRRSVGGGIASFKLLMFGVCIAAILVASVMRELEQKPDADKARALLAKAEGYPDHQAWLASHIDLALAQAFSESENRIGANGERYASYDASLFLPCVFRNLIAMARDERRPDVVQILEDLREREGILTPAEARGLSTRPTDP